MKLLSTVKFVGGTLLTVGIILFSIGYYESGYNTSAAIGLGTVMGAVFIFLMGVFFVLTEEMHKKSNHHKKIATTIKK
ncbi:hypothetical protein MXL46_17210 [Heyndrickxia sporothermodurans]|uniref:hypothetical protein n=1 Tax=Heyndrickxia sporothermodurans TaxID=46224 RepID=UPI002DBADCB6|nr:hypothetical protein [Heyndrickxia sporothermodurans]MEB6550803.1 hypothetical protein [Heyndrickxia sporothermodurans]